MKRVIPLLIILILSLSCNKNESDFIWEKSYGKGEVLSIKASSDSGLTACGNLEERPYFVRLDRNNSLVKDFGTDYQGSFSSSWFDTSGYIAAGSTNGKMLLTRYSANGNMLWEKIIDAGFRIDITRLFYSGEGTIVALGTASPDYPVTGATGLLFVRFDTTGQITTEKKINETSFIAANEADMDGTGNIYLAITRKPANAKTNASVAKYNSSFQKLWETELYNNPEFGAASYSIKLEKSGVAYVAGKTEIKTETGYINNSFLASLTTNGSLKWKRYLESSNIGTSLIFDEGEVMMLNKNCFIINILSLVDGADGGIIRPFDSCDSYSTDALGADMDFNFNGDILIAGSLGGGFYLALKSSK